MPEITPQVLSPLCSDLKIHTGIIYHYCRLEASIASSAILRGEPLLPRAVLTLLEPHSHIWGQNTLIISSLSPKRDWGPKRVNNSQGLSEPTQHTRLINQSTSRSFEKSTARALFLLLLEKDAKYCCKTRDRSINCRFERVKAFVGLNILDFSMGGRQSRGQTEVSYCILDTP